MSHDTNEFYFFFPGLYKMEIHVQCSLLLRSTKLGTLSLTLAFFLK